MLTGLEKITERMSITYVLDRLELAGELADDDIAGSFFYTVDKSKRDELNEKVAALVIELAKAEGGIL